MIGASHPTIWKFISTLKNQQSFNEARIEQYLAGQAPPPGKKKYRDCNARLRAIVNDFDNHNLLDYLRGISQKDINKARDKGLGNHIKL
uniref:Uncharacterized protein n=1 Tax=Romanomermis culicivorax TaxID=13658 RepID=A0A915I2P6_ROMCU